MTQVREVAPTDASAASPPIRGHIGGLDGLRALAVSLVLAAHLGYPRTYLGAMGVSVFFVLSGFLITGLLIAEHGRLGRIRIGAFYIRRALRLYPALLLLLLLVAPVHAQVGLTNWTAYFKAVVVGTTYMGDFAATWGHPQMGHLGHLWTLAIEEHFYLVWPILLALLLRVIRSRVVLAVVIALAVIASYLELWWLARPRPDFFYGAGGTLDTEAWQLLLGGLLAVVLTPSLRTWLGQGWRGGVISTSGLAAMVALVGVMWFTPWQDSIQFYADERRLYPLVTDILTVAMIVPLACNGRLLVSRLFSLAPVRYLGRISYGVYLYHYPIYSVVANYYPKHDMLMAVMQIGISLCVAVASYHLLERPFLRLKDSPRWRSTAA